MPKIKPVDRVSASRVRFLVSANLEKTRPPIAEPRFIKVNPKKFPQWLRFSTGMIICQRNTNPIVEVSIQITFQKLMLRAACLKVLTVSLVRVWLLWILPVSLVRTLIKVIEARR